MSDGSGLNEDVDKKRLRDNLNSTTFTCLAPSKIHGVGVFALRKIPAGVDPFNLPTGYAPNKSLEFTEEEVDELDDHAQGFIRTYLTPYDKNGASVYPVPFGGCNAIDISFYLNSTKGTKKHHNVEPVEELDSRGYMKLITVIDIDAGEELLLEADGTHDTAGRSLYFESASGREEDKCLVCSDSLSGEECITIPCCNKSTFCLDCGPTWFAGHCKISLEHQPADLQEQGCPKITNRWEVGAPSIGCPICHKKLSGWLAAKLLEGCYENGGFAKVLEKFEGKKVILEMKKSADSDESDDSDSGSNADSDSDSEPAPSRPAAPIRKGSRSRKDISRMSHDNRRSVQRMRRRIKYQLRSGLNGAAWKPRDGVWKNGTPVRVYMSDDGVWVPGTIVGWQNPQQRKEKHTADTLKFAKRDPPKCPKFKRGMYKVKYNNIKENGSVNPGSFEEDWFSDGDATLEKLS